MKVAFLAPVLQGFGGLERYFLDFLLAWAEVLPIEVITNRATNFQKVEQAYGLDLRKEGIQHLVDTRCDPQIGGLLQRVEASRGYGQLTQQYDLVVASSWLTPWQQRGKRGLYICHFPMVGPGARVQTPAPNLLTRAGRMQRDLSKRLAAWRTLVTSSEFGQHWLREYWQRESHILLPGVGVDEAREACPKKKQILACGFFNRPMGEPYGHKRHELMIDVFRELSNHSSPKEWELHLAGHVKNDPEGQQTMADLQRRAEGLAVHFHPNCDAAELLQLYRDSRFFWHATGYGVDQQREPARLEHFGIVTVEAMSWGCVPLVFAGGGQKEIVEPGTSGFWWETPSDLLERMQVLMQQEDLEPLSRAARKRALTYSPAQFKRNAQLLLEAELSALR